MLEKSNGDFLLLGEYVKIRLYLLLLCDWFGVIFGRGFSFFLRRFKYLEEESFFFLLCLELVVDLMLNIGFGVKIF